jgi:hypothetical protein
VCEGRGPADGAARPIVARHHLQWAVFLAAVAGIFYLGFEIVSPFFRVVAWSSVLVIAFSPVHRRLAGTIRRPALRALASTALAAVTPASFPQAEDCPPFTGNPRATPLYQLLETHFETLKRQWEFPISLLRPRERDLRSVHDTRGESPWAVDGG